MLRTTKTMKDKYEKIQNYLFTLIPEKWEGIYLYASVVGGKGSQGTGELYFYYLPKGILKKRPVNVYEVPQRFNINEEQYLKIVGELYDCIKDLKQDFIDTEQDLWSSVTISIVNFRFKVEYNYDPLPQNEEESNRRHIIWRYKHLKIGGEKKDERKILEEYFAHPKRVKRETYETGLYMKTENGIVAFDKEGVEEPKKFVVYEKEEDNNAKDESSEKHDENAELEKQVDETKKSKVKNQILNM